MRLLFAALVLSRLCCSAQKLPDVPDALKPAATEKLVRKTRGEGDQIYTCDGSSWMLIGPDAKLYDNDGKEVGSHFAGPTWEWSDGSQVVGRPIATATPDPNSIPWLLLRATNHQGNGVLQRVSTIQRLSTKGGKAPATGCDAAHKGDQTRSHYTAIYCFYAPR